MERARRIAAGTSQRLYRYKKNIASGAHSAAHSGWPSLTAANGIIAEFSGLDTTRAPLDTAKNNNQAATGTSGTTGSSGASHAEQRAVGRVHVRGERREHVWLHVVDRGLDDARDPLTSDATGVAWWSGYQIAAVSTAVNPAFSWTNSSAWQGSVAGFIPTGGGGGGRRCSTLRRWTACRPQARSSSIRRLAITASPLIDLRAA
jgi:hypothetical protein